jgi:hypothetical protein
MSLATSTTAPESIKMRLEDSEMSRFAVEVKLDADNVWVNNSVEYFAIGNTEEQTIYVNARTHNYVNVDGYEPISNATDLFTRTMSKAEAEALIQILQAELAKF